MDWKWITEPTVHRQRDNWVVRAGGIDTEASKPRPRQVGTNQSQRATKPALSKAAEEGAVPNAQALPDSILAVADRIAARAQGVGS